ncbi:MAG: CHAT domain-containing protein [Bacteroidetes bacterium]|nr:CHAT domain-containing protein [Bacteroidota bacterium]
MKHLFYILLVCSLSGQAQNFAKLWEPIQARIDKGGSFSNEELNGFLKTHDKLLQQNLIEKSILIDYLAVNAFKAEQYQESVDYFDQAIAICNSINDTVYRAFYLYDLACLYNHIGYYTDAESLFIKSLPTLAAVYGANSIEYTMRFKILAEMYVEMGNYVYAKSMNDALLAYFKGTKGEKDREYLIALNNDARISQGQGDYNNALNTFNKLLEIHASINPMDTADYATTLNNTAEAYRLTGNYKDAMALLEKGLALATHMADKDELSVATMYNNLGLCYKNVGDYKLAEEVNDKSIAIYQKLKLENSPDYSTTLNNQAELYRNLGRYKQALDLLKQVLHNREQSIGTKHQNYANALNNLALLFFDMGLYAEAEPKLLEAKTIYKETLGENHPFYANCLNSLAMLYMQLRRYKEAEALKLEAISIMKNTVGESHERYAYFLGGTISLYDILGNYDKAIENTLKANEIIKAKFGDQHMAYIDGLFNLAYLYTKTKDYKKAQAFYLQSLTYYRGQFADYFESMSEEDQMAHYTILGYRFDSFNSFVMNYTKLFPKENHQQLLASCFDYQLFIKSLLLNRSINTRKAIANSKDTALINTYNRWIAIKQQISQSFRDLDLQGSYWNMAEMEKQANSLEQILKAKSQGFASNKELSYKDIQQQLKADEAAITIIKEDQTLSDTSYVTEYVALILKKTDAFPTLIRIASSNDFESTYVNDYINHMYDRVEDVDSYNRFWKPIAAKLQGITKVYLSADGVYNQVNLYTLQNPVTKKYVLDEVNVSVLPNLSYMLNDTKSNPQYSAELYGFPDYDYDFTKKVSAPVASELIASSRYGLFKLVPLPGTKIEVENIAQFLQNTKWNVNMYQKELASEEQFKKTVSPKVLHIATHGYFLKDIYDKEDKSFLGFEEYKIKSNLLLQSGIMLAGASKSAKDTTNSIAQDGIFTAYEASLLNLSNTDLVVLSACETGLGQDMNNQGVFGLQRAFYIAGAKNLIMSLWSVDDDATQILMTEFYKEWSVNPTQQFIAKAFNKAQREVRKKYSHPYYWGAFVLLGN